MIGSRVRFLWVLCAVVLGVAYDAAPAQAQFTIFDFFDQGARRPPPRRYQQPYYQYPPYYDEGPRWRRRYERPYRSRVRERNEVSSESPQWTEVAKDADAKTILVLGDQMADGLAQGLREAFGADAKAVVKTAAKEGASLVGKRADAFIQFAKEKIAAENPAAIIVMLGVNDRRDGEENGKPVEFQSERWRTLYLERQDALLQVLKERHVPVYQVGLPSARNKQLSGVLAWLNGLYQQKAYVRNAKYVDVWDGFVDENGNYMIIGPDVNGNQRRLRMRDGMTLTAAGNRKLAFYVEKEIRRDLGLSQPVAGTNANTAPALSAVPIEEMNKPVVGNAYVGPVIPLGAAQAPALAGAALLGDTPQQEKPPETTGSVPISSAARPGRSDDFSWPPETRQALPPLKPETKAQKKKN